LLPPLSQLKRTLRCQRWSAEAPVAGRLGAAGAGVGARSGWPATGGGLRDALCVMLRDAADQ